MKTDIFCQNRKASFPLRQQLHDFKYRLLVILTERYDTNSFVLFFEVVFYANYAIKQDNFYLLSMLIGNRKCQHIKSKYMYYTFRILLTLNQLFIISTNN